MFWIGDLLCRRFHRFISVPHRLAGAFLVGMLVSSWLTYLTALMFASTMRPLLWGNLLFFVLVIATFAWTSRKKFPVKAAQDGERTAEESNVSTIDTVDDRDVSRPRGSDRLDWLFVGVYFIFACWLMFATLNSSGGKLQIGHNQFSDFGPNTAIMQSFALGHNFPTEYPHFPGDRIRYHFLFYFQAGNLEFLGLDPAWSLNLLSILSLVAMLILVMALGEVLFNSRAVGLVGSALFFFFGSLSYFEYLRKHGSLSAAIDAIAKQVGFLPSGFPYRGEEWGVWSLVVFLNQRHLAFAIAVLLLVLVFLVIRYRRAPSELAAGDDSSAQASSSAPSSGLTTAANQKTVEPSAVPSTQPWRFIVESREFIFCGVVLGLMPMWNSAVFVAAVAVLAVLFILFPLRKQMLALAIAAGVVALPQVIYLSTGSGRAPAPPLLHWGYTLGDPTTWMVVKYLGFTFGFKWLLIAFALVLATRLQRRFFLAISALLLVAFLLQLSVEVLANHKFLHIWLIIANLFVAYGMWRLWRLDVRGTTIPAKAAAVVLVVLITLGGFIDLFPIRNAYTSEVIYKSDRLIEWLTKETDPRAIFLTDRFVSHPILMAGRRVFYGWPYYAWSAGYRAGDRDGVYRQMWQERNPQALLKLLHDNNVSYVALDDGVRRGEFGRNMNEPIYRRYFPSVFQNGTLVVFQVPPTIEAAPTVEIPTEDATPAVNMFTGGKGSGRGQFDWPRGIASDAKGNIYVADANNGRLQRFSDDGEFLSAFGQIGEGEGEFKEPSGIAVDRRGNVYVADFLNRRVQKFNPDGTFSAQWRGPDQNFAPRDLAVGVDNSLYVADEGGARIVKFAANGKVVGSFGTRGSGDGQFGQITSVAVDDKSDRVFVADPRQRRIVVFDRKGQFIANWFVEQWQELQNSWYMNDIAVDAKSNRLYATSTQTDEVLVFDLAGTNVASLKPVPPDRLEGASSLTLLKNRLYVVNTFAARMSVIDLAKHDLSVTPPLASTVMK
jgi:DNA-binding beta-propeller fold protein YncE